jgi:hypothetical protein
MKYQVQEVFLDTNEADVEQATPELMNRVAEGHRRSCRKPAALVFVAADPLAPTATATTVRVVDGRALVTDGPFAETKEQLAGYYILECRDLDEAIDWAQRLPTECGGGIGSVVIRLGGRGDAGRVCEAVTEWPVKGVPTNPGAWITAVTRR